MRYLESSIQMCGAQDKDGRGTVPEPAQCDVQNSEWTSQYLYM